LNCTLNLTPGQATVACMLLRALSLPPCLKIVLMKPMI
jgi:hypothetical protein